MTSEAFWSEIHSRRTIIGPRASADPEPPAPAEPPAAEEPDVAGLSLDEFGQQREQLGIRQANSDFIGLSSDDDDRSGFPSWRTPTMPEQVEFTDLDHHAEAREAAGIPNLNDFGLPARSQRVNSSPWSL